MMRPRLTSRRKIQDRVATPCALVGGTLTGRSDFLRDDTVRGRRPLTGSAVAEYPVAAQPCLTHLQQLLLGATLQLGQMPQQRRFESIRHHLWIAMCAA